MDPIENERSVADELAAYALERGFNVETLRNDFVFQTDQRWIWFWRKVDGLACSGPADELEGTLHYNMQGALSLSQLVNADGDHQQIWSEAGVLETLDQAFELLKAWLVNEKDVEKLPVRCARRQSI